MEGHTGGPPSRSTADRLSGAGVERTHQQHRAEADRLGPLRVAVVTVSDSRNAASDRSGTYLQDQLRSAGHEVVAYRLIPDEPSEIDETLTDLLRGSAQVILFNGGTGIASRDGTFEVISRRLDKALPGFGELFRMLSFEEIGAAAMLSRAIAGTCTDCVLVCLPGSPAAVRLAWEKLLRPELRHLVREAAR